MTETTHPDPTEITSGVYLIRGGVPNAGRVFHALLNDVNFQQRQVTMYGKTHAVPRLEAWYGTGSYTFSGNTFPARDMSECAPLCRLRATAISATSENPSAFNSALVNLYRDGSDTVGWHSDDEPEMESSIVSVSLGAQRDFLMRRKDGSDSLKISLNSGDILVMGEGVQDLWQHSLPRRKRCADPRINVTFRHRS